MTEERKLKIKFYEEKLIEAEERLDFLFKRGCNDEKIVSEKREAEKQLRKLRNEEI